MSASSLLLCRCPADGHLGGCWLAEAEAIAAEAVTANTLASKPASRSAAIIQALAEAGYVREPDDDDAVLTLLDALVDAGVLGDPKAVAS